MYGMHKAFFNAGAGGGATTLVEPVKIAVLAPAFDFVLLEGKQ
jgi:hypothetical protein